jgi:serine protease Do
MRASRGSFDASASTRRQYLFGALGAPGAQHCEGAMTVSQLKSCLIACALLLSAAHAVGAQGRAAAATAVPLADLDGSIEALVRAVDPSVVQIFMTGLTPAEGVVPRQSELVTTQRASGSGVIVDADGYVMTNAHVVRGASRLRVEIPMQPSGQSLLTRRSRIVNATVIGMDDETDLAVLKIEANGLRPIAFGDSDALKAGQMVLAFGSPLGLHNSVSLGIVSATARQLEPDSPMVYVQTDASINPGNSGGPLVDSQGRLVGLNTLIMSATGINSGLGFAAPSNIVRTVFEQIRKDGRVRRGEIGIRAQTITPVLAAGLGLSRDQGAVLADIVPGSAADRAGLIVGDVVLTLDGKPIENGRQLQVNLYRRALGDMVKLDVQRGGKTVTASVLVVERFDPLSIAAAGADPRDNVVSRLGILGLTVDADLARIIGSLRAPSGVAVVTASEGVFDADGDGLVPGDVIHAVNGHWVADLPALRTVVDAAKKGDAVVLQVERRGALRYVAFVVE